MAPPSKTDRLFVSLCWAVATALATVTAPLHAQAPLVPATPRPGGQAISGSIPARKTPAATPAAATPAFQSAFQSAPQGPRDTKLVEKKWEELPNREVGEFGKKALGINPDKWKHAETDNFLLHYRRATEAQKVAREVEYDLWYVATALGATKDRYTRKSHVFVFEDDDEWKSFLGMTNVPAWSASFAHGDELFLNVRGKPGAGGFDSQTLAHETTHAVVARLFRGDRWPLWLNEGFAEYMGGASVAARKGQTAKRYQGRLNSAEMPLESLEKLTSYPSDEQAVHQLYQTSEKFVRFLMNELPKERFTQFLTVLLSGKGVRETLLTVYGDKLRDWDTFQRRYERFSK